jgi:signal transduction histidine kinase
MRRYAPRWIPPSGVSGHNDEVAGRTGALIAFFRRAESRGAAPTGWALAFDAAIAVSAAAWAVYEVAGRRIATVAFIPPELVPGSARGYVVLPLRDVHPVLTHASAGALAAAAMTALPLAARRLYPISVWLAIAAAIVIIHPGYVPPVALGTAVFAAYSAITHSRYRNLAIAVVAVVTFVVAGILGGQLPELPGRLTAAAAIVPAAAAGLGIRVLRRRLADSTARLSRAADEAKAATERALAAERTRIASELHDVVTHNVSVMIVQAGAARKIMASSPADAEDALLAVEATGREAMTELRNLLGLLSPAADGTEGSARSPGTGGAPEAVAGLLAGAALGTGRVPVAMRPQPRLGELDALIRRVSAAGVPVELTVSGSPRPLPQGADLAAYRVVQEGLTNMLRHAGAATAAVTVAWGENLEITVDDDGHGGDGRTEPGRGLLGLGERLALYGGKLEAGPRPEGGWRVRAVLLLPEPGTRGSAALRAAR